MEFVVPREVPHIDKDICRDVFGNVGSAKINRDHAGEKAVEDLLGHPPPKLRILQTYREAIVRERFGFAFRDSFPGALRGGHERVGRNPSPQLFCSPKKPLRGAG